MTVLVLAFGHFSRTALVCPHIVITQQPCAGVDVFRRSELKYVKLKGGLV